MGFTLAHPGAIVPIWLLARRRLPLPALVIGALSPDFEYLLRLAPLGDAGHDVVGIFLFCLPLSLIVLVAFETIVREPMADLLALPPRFAISPARTLAWWSSAAIAIVIGAATHVAWDGVTDGDRWIIHALPELGHRRFEHVGWRLLLEHTGSGLGFAVILAGLAASRDARAAAAAIAGSPRRLGTITVLLTLALAAAFVNGIRVAGFPPAPNSGLRFLAYAAVGGLNGLAAAIFGYSLGRAIVDGERWVGARERQSL